MSAKKKNDKVDCPICGKSFWKTGINLHVNSCLNAQDDQDENQSCQSSVSPPRKIARLENKSCNVNKEKSSSPTLSSSTSDLYHKPAPSSSTSDLYHKPAKSVAAKPAKIQAQKSLGFFRSYKPPSNKKDTQPTVSSPKSTSSVKETSSKGSTSVDEADIVKVSDSLPENSMERRTPTDISPESVSSVVTTTNDTATKPATPNVTSTSHASDKNKVTPIVSSAKVVKNNSLESNDQMETSSSQPHQWNQTEGKKTLRNFSVSTSHNNGSSVKKSLMDHIPLAEKMRPSSLSDYFGQEHILGRNKMLRQLLLSNEVPSMIIWGPPGCGKTTLAKIVAQQSKTTKDCRFVTLSATTSGIADVKEAIKIAKNEQRMLKRKTILFVDEIHRFNKLQQDAFLPHVEDGTITLIGATTENPSFQVNNALLSRCKVIVLEKLSYDHILQILKKALTSLDVQLVEDKKDINKETRDLRHICMEQAALDNLANLSDGDARTALNSLQTVVTFRQTGQLGGERSSNVITVEDVKDGLQRGHVQYDRTGEEHYNCASALQKSIRGSSDSGAIYWTARMLEGGEDPLFIARRLVVCASEDIGMADPQALPLAVACFKACHFIGMPECAINIAHCVTYLARAPKSNEAYSAMNRARQSIKNHTGSLPGVPLHLRNASTKLMKNIGYGKGYKYNHSYQEEVSQEYLPDSLKDVNFFEKDDT